MASYTRRALAVAVLAVSFVTARSTFAQDATNIADQVTIFPLPAGLPFPRTMVGVEDPVAAGPEEKLVYSNTQGTFGFAVGAGNLVADDITTTVPGGCKLRRFEFPVVGKVDPAGVGGPYTVDFALYSNCPGSVPNSLRPALIIPDTQGQRTFPDDAPRIISFVAPANVSLPTNLWFGVKFSRNNAGPVFGAPPLTGFSCDQFDFPGLPCNARLGGFPNHPHASFNLEIFADSACADSFTGYKNSKPSGSIFNPGANVFLADDIELGASSCNMIAYEVAVRGIGLYSFEMRNNCESGLIAGTQRSFAVGTGTEVKIARFNFDPPITLPQNLWLAAKVDNTTGSIVIAGQQACIGATTDQLGTVMDNACVIIPPGDIGFGIHGAFNLAVTCAGTAPIGACCDMIFTDENGDSVCREAPQMNCPWPWPQWTSPLQPSWVEGASCDSDPFPLPCGVAACCRPDDVCENLTVNQCNAVPPLDSERQWQRGRYCGVDGQQCPIVPCLAREGDCLVAHQEGGCEDPQCCTDVCMTDSYCCSVEWDRECVQLAEQLCSNSVAHDECFVGRQSALLVEADSSTFFTNTYANESVGDQGFCCRGDTPGATGFGTTWFKFVATDTSARISTCNSVPSNDSMFLVFAVGDPTTEETACATLSMIACSDDVEECGGGAHGRICIKGLTPGDTYYVMVAAKTRETKGLYQFDIRSPCFEEPIWISNDCNENKLPDGCELGRGTATDCNVNRVLDECDIASGTSFDCDDNGFPDECGLIETLMPKPPLPGGAFGTSVVMNGPWLVVGSGFEFTGELRARYPLHIYRRTPVGWKIAQTIDLPLPPTYVGMDDGWIAVTSDLDDVAYLLRLDGDLWVDMGTLQGPAIDLCARSGYPLAIDGDGIALSKGYCQHRPSETEELVFVFRREGLNWVKEAQLMAPSGGGTHSLFGASVALAGDRLIVGARASASAHVFRRENESWAFETTLYPPDEAPSFGRSAAFDGRTAVVGANFVDAAYVFTFDGTTWSYEAKLHPSGTTYYPSFGWSVGIAGNTAVTGAIYDAAYTFHRQGTQWIEQAELSPPIGKNVAFETYFGYGVATDGTLVVIGAPGLDSVYVFQPPKADCNENHLPDLCDLRDGTSPDCNHDDWPDECTVTDGTTPDCNHNRIPDGCEILRPFDYDYDGNVDLIDLAGFLRCFTGPGPAAVAPCCRLFDFPPDGDVDAADWAEFLVRFQGP